MENKIFEFDQRLDTGFLHSLYENDIENAAMSFDFFLNKYPQHLKEIEEDFIAGDVKGFRQKVHKAKPTFSYVGLTAISAKAAAIESMCDDEGDACADTKEGQKQFVINHRKWIDIAHYLGCHAIRTNCRGPEKVDKKEALKWSADSYNYLLEYAKPANISVVIENHGGVSNDPDWMVELMKKVKNPMFGTYPDWRRPSPEFDNYVYLQKTLPWAKGMSYRNQPTEELTAKMIQLSKDGGYKGWYGIESTGRDEIKKGIELLNKYLLGK